MPPPLRSPTHRRRIDSATLAGSPLRLLVEGDAPARAPEDPTAPNSSLRDRHAASPPAPAPSVTLIRRSRPGLNVYMRSCLAVDRRSSQGSGRLVEPRRTKTADELLDDCRPGQRTLRRHFTFSSTMT